MSNDTLRQQYMHERARIRRFVQRAEHRGYQFDENPGTESIPKNITRQDVERLRSYTPDRLYSTAEYTFTDIGKGGQAISKTVNGLEGRKIENSRAGRRGYQARQEAIDEGYSNVTEWRANTEAPVTLPKENADAHPLSEREYALLAARQSMPQETLEEMGVSNVDDLADTPMGMRFLLRWYRKEYPDIQAKMDTPATTNPLTGYSESDITAAENRAEKDANDYHNAGQLQETNMILDMVQRRVDSYGDRGAENLNRVLQKQIDYYGEQGVADALNALEKKNERLMEQIDELMNYRDYENGGENAARAYRALSDAITYYGEHGRIRGRELGMLTEALEEFEDEE